MSKELSKDYDWRTRVHYEQVFAEQCAIAVKEYLAKYGFWDDEPKNNEEAKRIGVFFSNTLNALYVGFKQYPDALDDFRAHCLLCNSHEECSQHIEAKEHQA